MSPSCRSWCASNDPLNADDILEIDWAEASLWGAVMSVLRLIATASVAACLMQCAIAPARAADPFGTFWLTPGGRSKLQIFDCGGALCGRLVWLFQPIDPATNQPKIDSKNADVSQRGRPLLGINIILGMRSSSRDKWDGPVYNARDGQTYSGSFTILSPNTAELKGCVAVVLCQAETWTRTTAPEQDDLSPNMGAPSGKRGGLPLKRDGGTFLAEISTGSGVVIGTKGEILTNSHVVEACQTITVKLASGNSQLSALVARDERNDLAVIRLGGTDNSPAAIAMFREGLPVRPGDAIVALGYPLSGVLATDANLSVGNVSALAGVADDTRYLQISAPVQPGNSGGPLLDASGHLVGIVTAKLNALRMARFTGDISENVNFALKAEVARTFLDSKGIKYQMAGSDTQLSPADVGEIGRPFTVHIECKRTSAQSSRH
jgi:S1-C subfamily serine protease